MKIPSCWNDEPSTPYTSNISKEYSKNNEYNILLKSGITIVAENKNTDHKKLNDYFEFYYAQLEYENS